LGDDIITTAQLKTILSLNVMSIASLTEFEKPDDILELFEDYMECGANILIAPTHLANNSDEKNMIIENTIKAADDKVFAAGELRLSSFRGNFDEYFKSVKDETSYLDKSGVSMIFLNGAKTLAEAKYALLAAKETTELPINVGLCFDDSGNLSDGTSPLSALITLQAIGADSIGCVFDTDIDIAMETYSAMCDFTTVPLFVWLNAEFMTGELFSDYIPNFVNYKCAMIGLSDKATLKHYIEMSKVLWQFKPYIPDFEEINAICSRKEIVFMDFRGNIIGDNKNILEIKIEDENTDVDKLLSIVNSQNSGAICFSVKDPDILDRLLYEYVGRPLVKSDEYGEISAKEKGALVINFDSLNQEEN